MLRVHKIALDPTNVQETYFRKAAGTARFAYNWALDEWKRQYQAGEKPNEAKLRKQLNQIKVQEFPWMLEVGKCIPQQAVKNLGFAFKRFFEDLPKPIAAKRKAHYPKFKKKGKAHEAFRIDNGPPTKRADAVNAMSCALQVPRLGWVRMQEALRFDGQIKSAMISRTVDRWFVALVVETEDLPPACKNHGAVGVDLGLSTFATLSTGEKIVGPRPYRALVKRLGRLQRSLATQGSQKARKRKFGKQVGSRNSRKAQRKVARLHARIANIRRDAIHQLTTSLASTYDVIGIESLNVMGMLQNHHLAQSLADSGFGEFRRQLEYKAELRGGRVVKADQWFPSSKRCSVCHNQVETLPLSVRTWTCTPCGTMHDRDVNAALNLKALTASSAVTACGDASAGVSQSRRVKLVPMKQEPNVKAMRSFE